MKLVITALLLSFNLYAGSRERLPEEVRGRVLKIYQANEKLHAAFFKYDKQKVEHYAGEVFKAASLVQNPKVRQKLKYALVKLKEISGTNKRKINDENYYQVSIALVNILKAFDIGDIYDVYHCPMVKKSWVQNSKKQPKVHNPYAPWMPHCGERKRAF